MTDPTLSDAFLALITAILALIAYYNNQRTVSAATTAAATKETAQTNTLLALTQLQATLPAIPATDTRARDASGNLTTNQTHGSQYWLDAGYTGPEPDNVTKAAFTDAQYAYDAAVARAIALKAVYGADKLSPALKELLPK